MTQEPIAAGPIAFGVGRVIASALSVVGRNIIPFAVITFIIAIPMIGMGIWGFATLPLNELRPGTNIKVPPGDFAPFVVFIVIILLTYVLSQAAINYGTFQDLRGDRAGIAECLARAFGVLPRLALAGLLLLVAILAMFAILAMLAAAAVFAVPALGIVIMIAMMVGFFVLYILFWLFVPVIVVEGIGPVASFKRSAALTRGHRWGIFGLLLLVALSQSVISTVLGMLVRNFSFAVAEVINLVIYVFYFAFTGALTAVSYYTLRGEKEGFGTEDLARVFD